MFDNRRLAFVLSALLVASAGLYGCKEEPDWGPNLDGSTGSGNVDNPGSGNSGIVDDGKPADPSKADAVCKQADSCMTNPACSTKDGVAACLCATVPERCFYDETCRGIGQCEYSCGSGQLYTYLKDGEEITIATCDMSVCNGINGCEGQLNPNEDNDGDGILNGVEKASGTCLDPKNPDSDGDGLLDGEEDLNLNGKYEPSLGESDPCTKDSNTNANAVKAVACSSDKMLNGSNSDLLKLRVAQFAGAEYKSKDDAFVSFNDSAHGVVGFFGSGNPITGSRLVNDVVGKGNFIEESNFKSSVPLAAWSKSGVYDKSLQIVPDHTVDRYKLTINMKDDDTLESIRDAMTQSLFKGKVDGMSGSTKCSDNQAIFYMARSTYAKAGGEPVRLYSGALACRSVVTGNTNVSAVNMMDDTISGTLVAPKGVGSTNGYRAYEQFVCQAEEFGASQGAVDFIWVIDNSGSMADEIENLESTVDAFTAQLSSSGIDYRLVVTTTDAYLIDEQGTLTGNKYSYDDQLKVPGLTYSPYYPDFSMNTSSYVNGLGVRSNNFYYPCMMDSSVDITEFKKSVKTLNKCDGNLNICGKGYEDGLKSANIVVERLALDHEGEKPSYYTDEQWTEFVNIKKNVVYKNYPDFQISTCNDDTKDMPECQLQRKQCMLRGEALKYIIFVSDEDSRQFKEDGKLSDSLSHLNGCLTGYKLEVTGDVYSMMTGIYKDEGVSVCNPSMKDYKEKLKAKLKEGESLEGMALEDIKEAYPEYYHMLTYYMEQYRKYAGTQSIVAFSLVGDAGLSNGGFCRVLGTCSDENCQEKHEDGSCLKCGPEDKDWKYDDGSLTTGANHGLSYIHLARFLSTVYNDENGVQKNDGKEGGYGSICNSNYDISVNSIFEDVVGRVAAHPLKGYPVASTIRVAAIINGKAVELKRGDSQQGWRYDASQNAIIFMFGNGAKKPTAKDAIAISYVVWKVAEG